MLSNLRLWIRGEMAGTLVVDMALVVTRELCLALAHSQPKVLEQCWLTSIA